MTRRQLMKAGAAGLAAAGMAGAPVVFADSSVRRKGGKSRLNSGIPLGGLGAGTVELRDDGLFHEWQILGNWRHEELSFDLSDAFFAIHTRRQPGPADCRVLATERRAGLEPVESIGYTGQFPFAELEYGWRGADVDVRLTAFSPFIPHDSKNSGLPAAIFQFDIQNRTHEKLEAGLAFCLPNPIVHDQPAAEPRAENFGRGSWQGLALDAVDLPEASRANGTLVLAAMGRDSTRATGSAKKMLGHFAHTGSVDGRGAATCAAVSRKLEVEPRGRAAVTFLLAWHFPHFIDAEKHDIGRMYANSFPSAAAVAGYVAGSLGELERRTREFRDVFYRSNLPHWLIDAVSAQFTTLVKSSWWTADGTFAIWEGLGCCGMQTTDVAYYGSISLVTLFPDLAKQAMRLSAKFQNPSGRIPHFFPGTFDYPDAYHMIDLMPKFTLMAWRDYLWTGDRSYLEEMWPHVRAAMEHNRALDRNGDFICDNHGIDQSYDGWEFEGASAYVGLINAAAFRAAACIARLMGEESLGEDYDRLASIGAASLDRLLWNGEYFDLFYDIATDVRDTCCMADQVNGQWFADLVELGDLLPREKVASALDAIYRYNRGPDYVRNGTWRSGGPDHGGQWSAVWSGTEYMVAAHMIARGLVEQGLSVAKTVYDRYAKDGRTWNHGECGDHYYRPLVVLAVLYAAQGFHFSAVDGRLSIDPAIQREGLTSPLLTPTGWGELRYAEQNGSLDMQIVLTGGRLRLSSLELGERIRGGATVTVSGSPAESSAENRDGKTVVAFAETTLGPGDVLQVHVG